MRKIFNLTTTKEIEINKTRRSGFLLLHWKIYMTISNADLGEKVGNMYQEL